jgi:anti-sigma-K factor RskA
VIFGEAWNDSDTDWGISMNDPELKELASLSHSITEADRVRHTPPPGLFDNILAALEDDVPIAATSPVAAVASDVPLDTYGRAEQSETVIDLDQQRSRRAPSAIRHRRRRRRLLLTSVAAGIALVIGLSLSSDDDTAPTFVAEATNDGLPEEFGGAATATVSVDDSPTLVLAFSDELPTEDPVELWLIKPDLSDMVSLGLIQPGDTEWAWPTGIDPNEYSLVDLSIEPDNGDPTHSGRSILRGELESI